MMPPSFSVVIPAYNEEARIEAALHVLMEVLVPADAQLIVVDDGSRDATASIAERTLVGVPNASVLRLARNTGKGAAVRAGVQQARGAAVVFMDADLASDLATLPCLLAALDDADVAVGSRTISGSKTINGTSWRALMAHVFNTMARPVMNLPIRDTQCGFKAFRADAARTIFGVARSNRFAFDVEVLSIARVLEMRVVEVPVTWTAVEGSKVSLLRDPLQMTIDLARIALRCRPRAVKRAVAKRDPINEMAEVGAAWTRAPRRPPAERSSRTELVRLFVREQRDPVPFHERLARDAVSEFGASLQGKTVVDLGCGPGHYTRALRRAGSFVVPIDLSAEEFALPGGPPGGQLLGNGMHLPLRSESADGLLCSNMIEHTPDPRSVVAEMCRVVRVGGWIWLSWTNWYSPWGGHDMSPYHYLGPERGLRVYRRMKGRDPKNCPGRSLFPLHIGPMLRMLRTTPGLRLVRAVPRYYPSQRWILAVPGLREVLAWNCLVVLERTDAAECGAPSRVVDAEDALGL